MSSLAPGSVLVTGANGYVGRALCQALGNAARLCARAPVAGLEHAIVVEGIDGATDWRPALTGVEAVVHLAARVHHAAEQGQDQLYFDTNTLGTTNFVRQAQEAGVRRFVYMSTAKVYGEGRERPYSEIDPHRPIGPYAASKAAAEVAVMQSSALMEVVVLQPPLIYGPEVKANCHSLMRLVQLGGPLPFGAVRNARSMIALPNLVDAIMVALQSEAATGKRFLVSDGLDLSTHELTSRLAAALGKTDRQWPIPVPWLKGLARLAGKEVVLSKLVDDFRVDASLCAQCTGWIPPVTVDIALAETAQWLLKR